MNWKLPGRIALDGALWLILPAIFLSMYVGRFHVPASSIVPHLRAVWGLLLALMLVRLLCAAVWRTASPILSSIATSALLYVLAMYYLLVLVGLQSWSRVISWDLIVSYAPQFGEVMDTLQVPIALAVLGLALPFAGLLYLTWRYFRWNDVAATIVAQQRGAILAAILLAVAALLGQEYYHFAGGLAHGRSEPFALTIFPEEATTPLEGNKVDNLRAAALDRLHEQARRDFRPNPAALKRNIVLIVVDALRPGNMSVLGYGRPTTPFLSQAAASGQAQTVTGMHASCAESGCGLLSLGSSVYVHAFPSRPFTLQEALQRHGYRVHMILGGDHVNFYGLRKIYGDVDSFFDGSMAKGFFQNDDSLVLARVAGLPRWSGEPTMFQFHLMSAHRLGKRMGRPPAYVPAEPYRAYRNRPTSGAGQVLPETVNYYDNGVLQSDAVIAEVLGKLKNKGYLEDALVVITADHGEALGEHGMYGHSNSVHEELLRIPFVLLSYGRPPPSLAGHTRNAAQVDVAPTILAELGMPRPATWVGVPLQERHTAPFSHFMQGRDEGLLDARDPSRLWKYWRNQQTREEYAFDLSKDPHELVNLMSAVPPALKSEWAREMLSGGAHRGGSRAGQQLLP